MVSSVLSRELTGRRVVIANTQCFASIFLWASGFVALEFLVDDWGALSLNAIRLGVSALFLMLWWILRDGLSVITHAPWSKGLIVGGLGWGIGSLLLFLGQRMSDPVTTTIVVAMMPLAGAAIEMIFEKRKLLWGEYLGIGLALSGGYLATGVSLAKSEVGVGVVLCFLAIFLFAWATRATTRQLGDLTATGQTTVTMIGGAVVSFGLYLGFLAAGSVEVQIGPVTPSVIWPLFIFLLPSSG
ncbi:MAG: DMT family transporter, partial [Proteobacteria bacterium]|nr:DMT family transporter [Pseudomonadota bacterium]